jgi:hypothetical protein
MRNTIEISPSSRTCSSSTEDPGAKVGLLDLLARRDGALSGSTLSATMIVLVASSSDQ